MGSDISYRRDSGAKARCHADTLCLTAYRPVGDTSLTLGYVLAKDVHVARLFGLRTYASHFIF